MKKTILSGSLFLLILFLCFEIGCILLCFFFKEACVLLFFWTCLLGAVLAASNRLAPIVTYDPEKETVTRRGLFWGFHREIRVADIVRTEIRFFYREGEYILLIGKEENYNLYESLSPNMPIRVPNTAKGREFVALFYNMGSDVVGDSSDPPGQLKYHLEDLKK